MMTTMRVEKTMEEKPKSLLHKMIMMEKMIMEEPMSLPHMIMNNMEKIRRTRGRR